MKNQDPRSPTPAPAALSVSHRIRFVQVDEPPDEEGVVIQKTLEPLEQSGGHRYPVYRPYTRRKTEVTLE